MRFAHVLTRRFAALAAATAGLVISADSRAGIVVDDHFAVTPLVTTAGGGGAAADANLIDPWGLDRGNSGSFGVGNFSSGYSTFYDGGGATTRARVAVLNADEEENTNVTGVVFNRFNNFPVNNAGLAATYLYATADGTVAAWNAGLGGSSNTVIDHTANGALYTGIAVARINDNPFLYLANFKSGKVEIYKRDFTPKNIDGAFEDPQLPQGYAPYNIQNIRGRIYVTYALQDQSQENDVPGAGHGFITVFDTKGKLLLRLNGGNQLNSPWGMVKAPTTFGDFSSDLLVANSGDGTIAVFDRHDGSFEGLLRDDNNQVISIDGLRGLEKGNGAGAGLASDVYYTAGPTNGATGAFGILESTGGSGTPSTPEPTSLTLVLAAACGSLLRRRRNNA